MLDLEKGEEFEILHIMNKKRSCHMSAFNKSKNRMYIMGGFDGYECLNSMEMLDLNTNEMTTLERMPSRIKNGCAVMNE